MPTARPRWRARDRPTARATRRSRGRRRGRGRRRRGGRDRGRGRRQARCQQHHAAQQRRSDDGAHDEARRDRRLPAHRQRAYQYHSAEGAVPDPPLPFGRHDRTTRRRGERGPNAPAAGAADRAGRRAAHGGTALVRGSDDRRRRRRAVADLGRAAAVDGPVAVARGAQRVGRPRRRPRPRPPSRPSPARRGTPTRVVVPALKIDLPIVGGPNGYPFCNVAMYIDGLGKPLMDLGRPGRGIATYLFAHARDGMFGPDLRARDRRSTSPTKMLGMIVQVYTDDNKLYLYEIDKVLLHQLNLDAAFAADTEQLWLQTSEGPAGTPGQDAAAREAAVGGRRGSRRRAPQGEAGQVRLIGAGSARSSRSGAGTARSSRRRSRRTR